MKDFKEVISMTFLLRNWSEIECDENKLQTNIIKDKIKKKVLLTKSHKREYFVQTFQSPQVVYWAMNYADEMLTAMAFGDKYTFACSTSCS